MSLTSTLSNVIIKNNTVSTGSQTPNGSNSALTTLAYDTALSSNADCEIFGNSFLGLNALGNMLSLSGGSHKISHNKLIRNSTSINAYINYNGSNDCMIVDNFFDSSTTNGTNEALAVGLTINSTYERNKNQIAYMSTLVNPYGKQNGETEGTLTALFDTLDGGPFIAGMENTLFVNGNGSPGIITAIFKIDLNTVLPSNVQIMNVIYGFYVSVAPINTGTTSSFYMNMVAGLPSSVSYTSPALSLADAHYQVSGGTDGFNSSSQLVAPTLSINNGGDLVTFQANTQYLKIDVAGSSVPQYYITNKNVPVYLNIQYTVAILASSTAILTNSPLIIRYRW